MRKILSSVILVLLFLPLFSQVSEDYPVRLFETSILIDNQTVTTPFKGMLEFEIHHRFGTVNNALDDLFGLWAPANIRLGLNYAITDRLVIGAGTAKNYKAQDVAVKYALLQQTSSGSVPVSLAFYGDVGLNLLNQNTFGPAHDWREIHRLSYFSQILVARQFGEKFSLQLAPTFIWFNAVEIGYKNAHYGISAGARYNVAGSHSIIAEYDQLFNKQENEDFNPKPQLALGWEIGTPTHAFQIFFANYKDILGQYNFVYNQNSISDGNFLIGLNVTVRF
ncbi:MAG: DUF5777 family beta-barrel protein [Bacteroidales bacterium]|jgi:hypothetical protein|nr:DUF5777 family beta-barrel protein [Bacteroidales bacterium]